MCEQVQLYRITCDSCKMWYCASTNNFLPFTDLAENSSARELALRTYAFINTGVIFIAVYRALG